MSIMVSRVVVRIWWGGVTKLHETNLRVKH